jgi:hypothetical protein
MSTMLCEQSPLLQTSMTRWQSLVQQVIHTEQVLNGSRAFCYIPHTHGVEVKALLLRCCLNRRSAQRHVGELCV